MKFYPDNRQCVCCCLELGVKYRIRRRESRVTDSTDSIISDKLRGNADPAAPEMRLPAFPQAPDAVRPSSKAHKRVRHGLPHSEDQASEPGDIPGLHPPDDSGEKESAPRRREPQRPQVPTQPRAETAFLLVGSLPDGKGPPPRHNWPSHPSGQG